MDDAVFDTFSNRGDPRFQRALDAAAALRPDWTHAQRMQTLRRALVDKHGLRGVDEGILHPWESVMLAAARLELPVDDPWIVGPLWVALLGTTPVSCTTCGGPCAAEADRCWDCRDRGARTEHSPHRET